MRILVVTECFWPDIYAVNEITEKLVARGHQVTVLTGLPDYTTTRIPPEYRFGQNRHQDYKGADVYRVPTIARRHGPIWRSLSYLSFAFNGSLKGRLNKWEEFDVIYVWEVSPVTMAVPAITLKKKYKKPLFLYCMDIWPECVKAMNIQEGTLAYKLIHAWTKRIYKQCDHIAVSSRPFFDYMERVNGIERDMMSYLPQFGDKALLEMDTEKVPNDSVDFLFVGNIGKAQNVGCLLRAMTVFTDSDQTLPNPNASYCQDGTNDSGETVSSEPVRAHLHIVGGGSEFETMVALAHELDLDDIVTFYGPVPFKESLKYYKLADACVLTLDGSNSIGDTLPGKLQTYMAAGKPILAAANGATAQIIEESRCGACVPAGDHEAYAHILKDFANDMTQQTLLPKTGNDIITLSEQSASTNECGENARTYFREHFMEEQHFETLEGLLRDLARR